MIVCLTNQAVSLIVSECISTCAKPCKTMQNNAPLLLQERDVSRKLWPIELLHHFKDSLHESHIGQENVPKSWGTHRATTNPASSSALGPPSKPYFGKTNFLSSHVFIRSKKRKPNKWIKMVDEAESTKTTGSIDSSD